MSKSILIRDMSRCLVCGRPREAIHHVFGGPNRKNSERTICKGEEMQKKRLTYQDRIKIEELVKAGLNGLKISKVMGVHNVTIYRELSRCKGEYSADEAQKTLT